MLGLLVVALFIITAILSATVLADSGIRGARAYRELSLRVACSAQYNSVIVRMAEIERSLSEPTFRVRPIIRASAHRPAIRRRATSLPVAA